MRPRLYYCDHLEFPLPPGHKFPLPKYRLTRELLEAGGSYELVQAPLASPETIALAHDPAYVAAFLTGALDAAAMRRIGFLWSPALVSRTLASVGGTLAASADAMASGFGGTLAGGTHHASRDTGAGFCVFNDVAVAISQLRRASAVRRAAVIDLDVHQGDGTAAIFADDRAVFTLSVHGENNFPFRKQPGCLDVALPDGTGDQEYLDAVERALPRAFDFLPDVVFYQSGVDPLAGDRLGRLALSLEGLAARDHMVFEACRTAGVPVVVTLGGGYASVIERTAQAHANTFRAAAKIFRPG